MAATVRRSDGRPAGDGRAERLERRQVGLTGAELAARVGVNPSTVSQWETGARRITPPRDEQLLEALVDPPAPRPDPLAGLIDRIATKAARPGGVTPTGLGAYYLSGPGLAARRAAIARGVVHEQRVVAVGRDGRPREGTVLLPARAPSVAAPPEMTGAELSSLMSAAGVSQSWLGGRLDVTQSAVWLWLRRGVPCGRVAAVRSVPEPAVG